MKNLLLRILAMMICLLLTACGETSGGLKTADMRNYPEKLDDWDAQNVLAYFIEIGAFPRKAWRYTQDKATCFGDRIAITEGVGYMDTTDAFTAMVAVYWIDPAAEGRQGMELLDFVRKNKHLGDQWGDMPIDHLVGNFMFVYSLSEDPEYVDLMDRAYARFLEDTGAVADF